MLVYGDGAERLDVAAELDHLTGLARTVPVAPGLPAHTHQAALFLRASGLAQGLVDAEFHALGRDAPSPLREVATELVGRTAAALAASWRDGFSAAPADIDDLVAVLRALGPPGIVEVRRPEGYAYYALYPEGHAVAGSALAHQPVASVIGLRGIGLGLAAMVAAGADARPPVTVRPIGHPFARSLALDPAMEPGLLGEGCGPVVVVDEGPGLSGSSIGAVCDWLEAHGVSRARLHAVPGHGGDLGPMASAPHRERWAGLPRHVVPFEALVVAPSRPWQALHAWVSDLVGPLAGPLEDLSGGAWRRGRPVPANPMQERRKFLAHGRDGTTWLVKFVGLGSHGEAALARATRLAEAGLVPRVAGLRHGFLVERWIEDAAPLDPMRHDRDALLAGVARYLAQRARGLPSGPGSGAAPAELRAMAGHNAGQALGPEAAWAVGRHLQALQRFAALPRVQTDNRLHAWEWLVCPDGRLLKTDAVDHCAAHDLVGCQPIAWDVAGAVVELGLAGDEPERLRTLVEREGGLQVPAGAVSAFLVCYLAFQLGACTLGTAALAGMPDEAAQLGREAARYADGLRAVL